MRRFLRPPRPSSVGGGLSPAAGAQRRLFFFKRRTKAVDSESPAATAVAGPTAASAAPSAATPAASSPDAGRLAAVEAAVRSRRSCKFFDPAKPVDRALLERLLASTTRAPTGFNLQPWTCVVATDAAVRAKLAVAALGQSHVTTAPVVLVFAGDLEPVALAPASLELGLQSGYYRPGYGPQYLRMVNYMLHGGPQQTMAVAKNALSAWYTAHTHTPLLSVPLHPEAYAWKQAMIPVTTFVMLATSAGLDTCIIEGIDGAMVRQAVGLPDRYSVPCVVCVGHRATDREAFHAVMSPRFSTDTLIRWNKF